jgi:hypothetical protein
MRPISICFIVFFDDAVARAVEAQARASLQALQARRA